MSECPKCCKLQLLDRTIHPLIPTAVVAAGLASLWFWMPWIMGITALACILLYIRYRPRHFMIYNEGSTLHIHEQPDPTWMDFTGVPKDSVMIILSTGTRPRSMVYGGCGDWIIYRWNRDFVTLSCPHHCDGSRLSTNWGHALELIERTKRPLPPPTPTPP